MSSSRVAVVTGGNKGIGFSIVKFLCQKFDGDVFLTARDEKRGKDAVAELNKQLLHPKFHQLDIDDVSSIQKFRDYLKDTYGGLDVLVNNAGIAYKQASTAPFAEQAEVTVKTNFFGTLNVCKELFPLLRPHASILLMELRLWSDVRNVATPVPAVPAHFLLADMDLDLVGQTCAKEACNGFPRYWAISAAP